MAKIFLLGTIQTYLAAWFGPLASCVASPDPHHPPALFLLALASPLVSSSHPLPSTARDGKSSASRPRSAGAAGSHPPPASPPSRVGLLATGWREGGREIDRARPRSDRTPPRSRERASSIRPRERRTHRIGAGSRGIQAREETGGDWSVSASSSRARADPRWNRRVPDRKGPALWIHRSQELRSNRNLFLLVTLKSRPFQRRMRKLLNPLFHLIQVLSIYQVMDKPRLAHPT
ncbi:hypothetical protein VPH35_006285 [Triticum aestivum]